MEVIQCAYRHQVGNLMSFISLAIQVGYVHYYDNNITVIPSLLGRGYIIIVSGIGRGIFNRIHNWLFGSPSYDIEPDNLSLLVYIYCVTLWFRFHGFDLASASLLGNNYGYCSNTVSTLYFSTGAEKGNFHTSAMRSSTSVVKEASNPSSPTNCHQLVPNFAMSLRH